jgi:RNA polymerase sigma-70 factor (ECF subfamily)
VAEDIATEVFIRYWHKEKDFTNEVAIKSFLRKSIKNACINYLLKMQRQKKRTKLLINSLEQNEDFVLNTITQAELIIEAWNIIETLSPECRRVIIHGYVKNIDNKKIAQLLKLSTQTVANHKTRGLRLIRGRFKDLERITK